APRIAQDLPPGDAKWLPRVRRIDAFTAKPIKVTHHENLKPRAWFQRVHQSQESWPVRELGTRDPVVDINVLVGHRPTLATCVGPGVLNLARNRLLLVGNAGLVC